MLLKLTNEHTSLWFNRIPSIGFCPSTVFFFFKYINGEPGDILDEATTQGNKKNVK